MQIYTLPDITPNSAAINLATVAAANGAPSAAVWINATASGTSIRFGDTNVAANRGQSLPTGIPFCVAPRASFDQQGYQLSAICVYGTGTDKISITYGQ